MFVLMRKFSSARIPLIKFVGKRLRIPISLNTNPAAKSNSPHHGANVALLLPAMYGRPALSEMEAECIESGGASMIW